MTQEGADREKTKVPEGFRRKAPWNAAQGVRNLTEMAMMLALIEAVKRALDFLPNVELVTSLFLVFTILYGRKTILVSSEAASGWSCIYMSGHWRLCVYLCFTVIFQRIGTVIGGTAFSPRCSACSSAQPVRFRIGSWAGRRRP